MRNDKDVREEDCSIEVETPDRLKRDFGRQLGLDETLQGIEAVTPDDVQRVAADLFRNGALSATVLGNVDGLRIPSERLDLQ